MSVTNFPTKTGIGGGGESFDAQTTAQLYFDFIQSDSYVEFKSGTGANVVEDITLQDANHIGVLKQNTGTTTGGIASVTGPLRVNLQVDFTYECSLILSNAPDGTDDFVVLMGLANTFGTAADPNHGTFFKIDRGSNATNWLCCHRNGGTLTEEDSGVAFDTDWVHLKLSWDASSQTTTFQINGSTVATVSANAPDNADLCYILTDIYKTAGTTDRYIGNDIMLFKTTALARY